MGTQPVLEGAVLAFSCLVPVGEHRLKGQELTETPEALALTHAPAKAASFHTKSAFHTPGYPWRAIHPSSHLSFHIKSSHPQRGFVPFPAHVQFPASRSTRFIFTQSTDWPPSTHPTYCRELSRV